VLLLTRMDLGSAVVLASGFGLTFAALVRFSRRRDDARHAAAAALGAGLMLYAAFVLRIGGDFIVGRFWTPPLWISIILLATYAESLWRRASSLGPAGRIALVAAAGGLLFTVHAVCLHVTLRLYEHPEPTIRRSLAHEYLTRDLRWQATPEAEWFRKLGELARQRGNRVARIDTIGFSGVAAGREVTIIDSYGLADPLVARLRPVAAESETGHIFRRIPPEYISARETGSLSGLDPDLRSYVSKLRLITRGPLWSPERFKTIVLFNAGAYDRFLEAYESH